MSYYKIINYFVPATPKFNVQAVGSVALLTFKVTYTSFVEIMPPCPPVQKSATVNVELPPLPVIDIIDLLSYPTSIIAVGIEIL